MSVHSPWLDLILPYLCGRLSTRERNRFEAQAGADPGLGKELAEFSLIRDQYQALDQHLPTPSPDLFSQICARIDPAPEPGSGMANTALGRDGLFHRAVAYCKARLPSPGYAWTLAAVQLAIIFYLVLPGQEPARYSVLTASGAGDQLRFHVVFTDTAQEKQIRELLRELGAGIVEGPGEAGQYVIAMGTDTDREQALDRLRASDLVRFAGRGH